MVRDDALVTDVRPNTKAYSDNARRVLGFAVTRARESLGHQWRPSFAKLAGLSVRSLVKLESGEPVGPTVYEAVARIIPGWTEDTPRHILEGGAVPESPPVSAIRRPLTKIERLLVAIYWELLRNGATEQDAHDRAIEIGRRLEQDERALDIAIKRESEPAD